MSLLMSEKNVLIMGVRNKWSIAWGIVEALHDEGANIIITYQGDREKKGADDLTKLLGKGVTYQCDISKDLDIDSLFSVIKENHGVLHGLVHSIAHAYPEDLKNDFVYTSRDGFLHALDISAYSLIAISRKAMEIMPDGGSIMTLTYIGSEKVLPGYNIMGVAKSALETSVKYLASDLGPKGIRVNAISAGPIKTMSAKGVSNFSDILDATEEKAPLRRRITQKDLGKSAVYLLSDLSCGMSGEIIHVDCGFNIMGI